MTTEENSSALPLPHDDPVVSAGLDIAMKWGAALGGPEKLKIAFEALEPQLKREHQIRLRQLDMQREATARAEENARAAADRMVRLEREKRQHALWMTGLYLGSVISVAMLVAGIYAARDSWWLSLVLCGPSLVAMGKLYVLRRNDPDDMRAVSTAARSAANAAQQAQPPPVP
ncbi:hypothetical protein GCM10018980_43200 [Streptomyces capoamus]|uniref:DUF2335 domain-containing protein n=1 Tax=Streptomyces capoamus TaxID=68183 RepID=A0A919KCK2_9ACTN|nr:hypothetical protein [Streptomyces capoamus]GGW20564.1 hypothetical protein GCM10010501_67200 [Streptomyces libani subsp. rufus]GHG56942.1 hypothetical protein GCM10018980_43200 [Streptomyces capoamus]